MLKFREMDENVAFAQQRDSAHEGPFVLVNVFSVEPEDLDEMLAAFAKDSAFFKSQPGLISAQLHRGIGGSTTFLNYVVWESLEKFRAAQQNPEFREHLAACPSTTTASPHLFTKIDMDELKRG